MNSFLIDHIFLNMDTHIDSSTDLKPNHYKKSLEFRGTELLGKRLFLLGMSPYSEENGSSENHWLQSRFRGNLRGNKVSEEQMSSEY